MVMVIMKMIARKEVIKMKKLWFGLIVALILVGAVRADIPNPGHPASSIGPGSFSSGNYTFPDMLTVNGTLNVTGNQAFLPAYTIIGSICGNNQVLKWNSTSELWYCAEDENTGTITGSGTAGYVTYWTGTSTISGSSDLQWDEGSKELSVQGKVGIGTTSPLTKIEAYGADAGIIAHNPGNSRGGIWALSKQRLAIATTISSDDLLFGYGGIPVNSTNFVPRMFIDNGKGYVGINTTSPQATLDVNGELSVGTGLFFTGNSTTGHVRREDDNIVIDPPSGNVVIVLG